MGLNDGKGISADSRGVLVHSLMALANETKDEVVYSYAMLLAKWDSRGKDAGEVLLGLIRALAENRRHTLDEMRKVYERFIDPPVIALNLGDLKPGDFSASAISIAGKIYRPVENGAWLDTVPLGELFHSLIRRLTRRLRRWYKGRWQ